MSQTTNSRHPDFKTVEAQRQDWDRSSQFRITKTADPEWRFGQGANSIERDAAEKKSIPIDPYEEGRPSVFNYKLQISGITPRPIAFLSTRSADGETTNLAPFSYFNVMGDDPPIFAVGFACGTDKPKDTLRNLIESRECVINIISESFIEAANSTSVNTPYGVSEWDVSGLTPAYDCETVKCARVKEAVFSIEAKVDMLKGYESKRVPGEQKTTIALLEGTRFWVREDALNDEKNMIDPAILRPMSRLGGIRYARVTEGIEIPRPDFEKHVGGMEGLERLQKGMN